MSTIRKIGFAFGASVLLLSSQALAEGDAAKGEKVFKKCMACHSVEEGTNKVGPSLYGIVGRPASQIEDYRYSKINHAAEEAGLVCTEENIFNYLEDPQGFLEGYLKDQGKDAPGRTKMAFKLKKEDERLDVIAYLKSVAQ